jgi:hypothetical protein
MAAAGEPRHHRLGNAGYERGCDRGVGGGPAVLENLETRIGSSPMASRYPRAERHLW